MRKFVQGSLLGVATDHVEAKAKQDSATSTDTNPKYTVSVNRYAGFSIETTCAWRTSFSFRTDGIHNLKTFLNYIISVFQFQYTGIPIHASVSYNVRKAI